MLRTNSGQTVDVEIRPWVVIRTALIAAGLFVAAGAIGKMSGPLTLITTSFFLAVALNPSVSKLSKFMPKGSRALSVAVAYLVVVGFLSSLILTVIPPVTKQIGNFANQAPAIINDIQNNADSRAGRFIERFSLEDEVDKAATTVKSKLGDIGNFAFSSAQTALTVLINTITVLVLTFLMLVDGPIMMRKMFGRYKDKDVRRFAIILAGWIFGTPLPYPLVLTAAMWICGLIPLIGATLGATIVVAVSAFVNWKVALALGVYFFVYQQIENATIQPRIQGKAIKMSPLIVLIVVLLSASLGGLFTAFIALPIAGCLQLLFNEFIIGGNLSGPKKSSPNNWLSRTIRVAPKASSKE
jgi:predicted PurR-regulated permease PerM